MKHFKHFLFLAILFVTTIITAQSTFEKWPEIKAFHGVMSQTFHPAEDGNFAPIKARAEEMMLKAALVVNSNKPKEFGTDAILASAKKLVTQSTALNKLVIAKADDKVLFTALNELHDSFHEIVGLCADHKK